MNQNYNYGNYGGYGGAYQPATVPSYTPQPSTNKIYVTSIEDAMQRFASPNSTMIYVLQDESTVFEIYTDGMGKKIPKVKKLVDFVPEQAANENYVTRNEFDELKQKLEQLLKGGNA